MNKNNNKTETSDICLNCGCDKSLTVSKNCPICGELGNSTPNRNDRAYTNTMKKGRNTQNSTVVDTISESLDANVLCTGGRKAEVLDTLAHLLCCRKICQNHKLMGQVRLEENK